MKQKTSFSLTGLINQVFVFCLLSTVYHMLSLFHILMLRVSNCRNLFFFITSVSIAYMQPLLSPSTFGSIFFMPYPTLFHVPLFQASSMKVSCHFVRHICIAVPRQKQWLEKRCAWKGDAKSQKENKQVWPVIYQNNRCMGDKKTSLHTSFGILHSFFIYLFSWLWQKKKPI